MCASKQQYPAAQLKPKVDVPPIKDVNYRLRVSFPPLHSRLLVALVALLLLTGCAARRTPDLERIFAAARARSGKRPIIVIPGILGSRLVNRRTGEEVWPSVFRSSDDDLSLPVSPDLLINRDDLIAARIIDTIRLARLIPSRLAPEVYVYYELLEALERYGGYRAGDWDAPPPGGDQDTFYVFPYDWRRDNVESARQLVRHIEELKVKLNRPDLRFNIVAHSMGGLVARYAAMYADADLPTARERPQPTWAGAKVINKIFMFGTPNGGSAEAFATLLEGFSLTEGLRRRVSLLNNLTREDALTAPALFQLLPHGETATFLDEDLRPLALDLYDPAVWQRYGWSAAADPKYRERLTQVGEGEGRSENSRRATSLNDLDAYFAEVLGRAKRFHEALNAASPSTPPVALYAFGGDCEETLAAPVILRDEKRGRWVTLTAPRSFRSSSGRRINRREATQAMYEPGDGRVTRRSLLGESAAGSGSNSLFNTTLPISYAVFACDLHSDVQKNKILQDNALTLLVGEALK